MTVEQNETLPDEEFSIHCIQYTCLIARFNPRRLFLFYACDNVGHYQSTMTPNRDVLIPNRDVMSAKCIFSLNVKQARVLHCAHERLSIYAMIVMPGQIEILSQGWINSECRNKLNKVFLHKLHMKCIKMSNLAIINDNNNFAPSIFSHCVNLSVIVLDLRSLRKTPRSKTITFRFHTMTSKKMVCSYYCLNI